jgi:hypothetical protein
MNDRTGSNNNIAGIQLILEVGADGGSIMLFGRKSGSGYLFTVTTNEAALLDDIEHHSVPARPWVPWGEALQQLDTYPWVRLYPLSVHPEFQSAVKAALKERGISGRSKTMQNWAPVFHEHGQPS